MAIESLNCRWYVSKTNHEYVEYISKIASVSPVIAQILINRGLKTPEQIDLFLNPHLDRLSDPFELQGMNKAVQRIIQAKNNNEKVLICGDYDADGITATSIMLEGFRKLSMDVQYYIPNRLSDGYGFGISGVNKAISIGAKLIITVDSGITSFEATSKARRYGIDVIITDHHEPLKNSDIDETTILPEAVAIVNPKVSPCSSAQHFLSGAGVAFKVIQAILGNIDDMYELLDLAALGTSADVVPLQGDNRIFIKEGINLVQSGKRVGIKMLKSAAGIKPDFFKPSFLNFILIPRINAAGRIDDANDVVRLLTTKSEAEAEGLAVWLNNLNVKRQQIEEAVYNEALQKIKEMNTKDGAIIIASEGWHIGVIGIVASRIAESYYRPTLVLSIDNGIAKGSSRSIPPFNIHAALQKCKAILNTFGGHKQAAGLSLQSSNIDNLRAKISEIFLTSIHADELIPSMSIDVSTKLSDINANLVNEISKLEPFGCGNEEPLFGAKTLEAINPRIVGNNHLKMYLKQNGRGLDCIGFDFGNYLDIVESSTFIDAAFCPTINEWDGGKYLQLNLKAIRPTKNENNDSRLY